MIFFSIRSLSPGLPFRDLETARKALKREETKARHAEDLMGLDGYMYLYIYVYMCVFTVNVGKWYIR